MTLEKIKNIIFRQDTWTADQKNKELDLLSGMNRQDRRKHMKRYGYFKKNKLI